MREALEKKLAAARLRCGLNLLLVHAAVVLAIAGIVAAAALAAEKLLAVPVVEPWTAWAFAGAAAALIAALSLLRAPGRMDVALLMDGRLAFRERFSTALAMSASEDPFARAATREAHQAAERLDVHGRFPVRPSGHWLATVATWAIAAGVFLFLPEMDLLGYLARDKNQQNRAARLKQARVDVRQATSKVTAAVQQVSDKQLLADVEELGKITQGLKPAEVRREAIRKLGELADKLREMEGSSKAQAAGQVSRMLRNLRTSPNALNNDLNRALAGGNFPAASRMLRDLMNQLNEGKLSEEDKRKLAEQLKDLAEQLGRLGDERQQTADALQREGMDAETAKKLAGMTEQELREALKQQGLSDEQIDKIMEKMSARRNACRSCQGLAKSLARCSGASGQVLPNGLVGLVEALDGMESDSAEQEGLEEALREIARAVGQLGEGACEGFDPNNLPDPNAIGLWKPGGEAMPGSGPGGGRARAWGTRPTGDPEDVGHGKTGVRNKPSREEPEIIASWLFKGPQARGVSKRKLTAAVQASKDSAAEAIRDNKIPRKYEGAVKKYFGGFERSVGGDANTP